MLVTGASGLLGGYVLRELAAQSLTPIAWSGSRPEAVDGVPAEPVDLADAEAVAAAFKKSRPRAVIHAGAVAAVAECHHDPERARRVNVDGSVRLAELAARAGARLVYVSTDLVFDGGRAPYREGDSPTPLSVYGRTKAEAEQAALCHPGSAVARLSLLFGPSLTTRPSFYDKQLAALRGGPPVPLFEDEWRTPLSLKTAARALVALALSEITGIVHVGGPERMSRLNMGRRLAAFFHAESSAFVSARRDESPAPEPRPRDTSLDSTRWRELFPDRPWPSFEDALHELHPA